MSVRLSGPSEEPSLVQTMAAASGSGQLSFSSSPGCTEHRVGLEFWFLVGGSAERRAGGKGAQKREREVGEKRNKHECKTRNTMTTTVTSVICAARESVNSSPKNENSVT